MDDALRIGLGRHLFAVPPWIWRRTVARTARTLTRVLARVPERQKHERDFAVAEIIRTGRPVRPEIIAAALEIPLATVRADLEALDRRMILLHRDDEGAVEWAYPVSAARTPHRVRWKNGPEVQSA